MIPAYFWIGGMAGASSTLAVAARLSGNARLARSAVATAAAGVVGSPVLLVADLGRPGRFANMLRVAKVTSPMSLGTWVLSGFCPAAALAAAAEPTGRVPRLGRAGEAVAGALGPAMATYTAVLLATTAVPAWHDARRELPFVFAGSAAASAGAAAAASTPVGDAGPVRRLVVLGAALETAAERAMERRLGELGRPYSEGLTGRLSSAATALTVSGAVVVAAVGSRRRWAAVAGGALVLAGSMAERYAVVRAGTASALAVPATTTPAA